MFGAEFRLRVNSGKIPSSARGIGFVIFSELFFVRALLFCVGPICATRVSICTRWVFSELKRASSAANIEFGESSCLITGFSSELNLFKSASSTSSNSVTVVNGLGGSDGAKSSKPVYEVK